MQQVAERNKIVVDEWVLEKIPDFAIVNVFNCGDEDLNDYFLNDAQGHKEAFLNETYILYLRATGLTPFPVALVSLCNDVIKLQSVEDSLKQKDDTVEIDLPRTKRYRDLPAVKIARLGVHQAFQKNNIGSHLMNLIKCFFTTDNRTGCRFITVDAYNKETVLNFYSKNNFQLIPSRKKQKKPPETIPMFFDLKRHTHS